MAMLETYSSRRRTRNAGDEDMLDALIELAGEVSIAELDTDTLHILRAILEAEIERDLDD